MLTLTALPEEVLSMILDSIRQVDEDHPNWSLSSVASTCKTLHRLALPHLYQHVAIPAIGTVLLPLAYRLMKDANVAQLVTRLECIYPRDTKSSSWQIASGRLVRDWDSPPDFHKVCMKWLSTHLGLDNETAVFWGTRIRFGTADYLFTAIAHACPNLTHMIVQSGIGGSHFKHCELFAEDRWPWKSLRRVDVFSSVYPPNSDHNCFLIGQLSDALSSGRLLEHFGYRNLRATGIWTSQFLKPRSLRLRSLDLFDADDAIDNTDLWRTPVTLLGACVGLESFQLRLRVGERFPEYTYTSAPRVFAELQAHQDHLRNVLIEWNEAEFLFNDGLLRQRSLTNPLSRADVVDFSTFSKLERLFIPAPMLLGIDFIYRKPGSLPGAASGSVCEDPAPDFGRDYTDALADNLPRSIRHLTVIAEESYQTMALSHALAGLVGRLDDCCPLLKNITVIANPVHDFEGLDSSPQVQAARQNGLTLRFQYYLLTDGRVEYHDFEF